MAAEQRDLEMEQGSTFEWLILVRGIGGVPLDMTNYIGGTAGVRGHIRRKYSDADYLKVFSISVLDATGVAAAVAGGMLHITSGDVAALEPDASGKCYLLVRLDAADTAELPSKSVYDIEIEDTYGYVFKPYRGSVVTTPEATKA